VSLKFRDAGLDDVAAVAGLQNAAAGAPTARFVHQLPAKALVITPANERGWADLLPF
jgi:hypothetical protein